MSVRLINFQSFGVFQTYYSSALGESQSTISWVGSIQLWVVFVISTFSGRALDAGLLIPTFIIGCTVQLFGIFMTSLCKLFWQLVLAQGFCTGVGMGMFFCPSMGLVTTYFKERRALAIAIVSSGNSVGKSFSCPRSTGFCIQRTSQAVPLITRLPATVMWVLTLCRWCSVSHPRPPASAKDWVSVDYASCGLRQPGPPRTVLGVLATQTAASKVRSARRMESIHRSAVRLSSRGLVICLWRTLL